MWPCQPSTNGLRLAGLVGAVCGHPPPRPPTGRIIAHSADYGPGSVRAGTIPPPGRVSPAVAGATVQTLVVVSPDRELAGVIENIRLVQMTGNKAEARMALPPRAVSVADRGG